MPPKLLELSPRVWCGPGTVTLYLSVGHMSREPVPNTLSHPEGRGQSLGWPTHTSTDPAACHLGAQVRGRMQCTPPVIHSDNDNGVVERGHSLTERATRVGSESEKTFLNYFL
jgi:hypothetical protein